MRTGAEVDVIHDLMIAAEYQRRGMSLSFRGVTSFARILRSVSGFAADKARVSGDQLYPPCAGLARSFGPFYQFGMPSCTTYSVRRRR
jgi:hypothetical protein